MNKIVRYFNYIILFKKNEVKAAIRRALTNPKAIQLKEELLPV